MKTALLLFLALAGGAAAQESAQFAAGWDPRYGLFQMALRVEVLPGSRALEITGGALTFKDGSPAWSITQGSGAGSATTVVGSVVSPAGTARVVVGFTGVLSGAFGAGSAINATVTIPHGVHSYTVPFSLPCQPGTIAGAPTGTGSGGLANPVRLTGPIKVSGPAPRTGPITLIFDNTNIGAVTNGAKSPDLVFSGPVTITTIITYHYNNGRGQQPGSIALRDGGGNTYGPFVTLGAASGSTPFANWTVNTDVTVPAGIYTVVDSSPSTWSQNFSTHGEGFVRVWGRQ